MSKTRVCSTCSAMIPDADLESGAAIALLGKNYCATCKGQAAKEVSLDDLMQDAPPKPSDPTKVLAPPKAEPRAAASPKANAAAPKAAAPAPKGSGLKPKTSVPKPTAPPPSKTPPPGRAGTSKGRRRPMKKAGSKGPLIAIGVIVGVAAVLGGVVMSLSGDKPEPPPVDPGPVAPAPTKQPETPEQKAQKEFARVEAMSRQADVALDDILAEVGKIEPLCKGTPYQAKLEMLRNNTIKQKEGVTAAKALEGLVEKLQAEVAADKDFRGYARLMEQFREARQKASGGAPRKLSDIQKIQADYSSRYEKAAEPFFRDADTAARQLAREKRYDDALAQIDRFPAHFRQSGAWSGLQRLRREIEASKKRNSQR